MSKFKQPTRVGFGTYFSALAVEKAQWLLYYMYYQEKRFSAAVTTKCMVAHDQYLCAMSGAPVIVGDIANA